MSEGYRGKGQNYLDYVGLVRRHESPSEALRLALVEAGASQSAVTQILHIAVPTAEIYLRSAEPRDEPLSKFGGRPDLPRSVTWPLAGNATELTFLAQIRCDDLPKATRQHLHLPSAGVLSFFYDLIEQPRLPTQDMNCRVFYFDNDEISPRNNRDDTIIEHEILFREDLRIPHFNAPTIKSLQIDRATMESYRVALEAWETTARTHHYIGGHAEPWQYPMEEYCALIAAGTTIDSYHDPKYRSILETAYQWSLLLQIDSDDALNICLQNIGRLYFWMRTSDLTARRFDQCLCILQDT